jgi:hypothetical protein
MAAEKIRIIDLKAPVLSPLQEQTLSYAAANPVVFDKDVILAAARERTGLSDFGADDFLPRLEAWAKATDEETELSPVGRLGIWNEMVRFAANRLWAEDLIKRHPEILKTEITTPVVVAGLPRSGTTYLLQLLAGDRRMRSLPYWEAVRPIAEPFVKDGADTRHELCAAEWAQQDAVLPYIKSIHEFSPDHISEDVEMQCIDFGSYYLDWLSMAKPWRDYYFAHDHTPVYQYMRKMFQVLSWQRGPSQWVTKCPQHMEQLLSVNAALPGSTTVINHRDPVASIQSAITGVAYSARLTRTRVDIKAIGDYWVDRYERLLQACVRDRDSLDPAHSHDVYFHELMADPIGVLETIYEKAGIEFDDDARADFSAAIAANSRGKHGQLVYDLREDFGLEPAVLRERFSFYFDRFPVRIEVK